MIQKEKQLFINDYYFPGMLNSYTYRSTLQRGTIFFESFPDYIKSGCRIITSKDIPGKKYITFLDSNIPILTQQQIHYKGEPLYIILYDKDEKLEETLKRINLEKEPSAPYVFNSGEILDHQIVYKKTWNFPEHLVPDNDDNSIHDSENIAEKTNNNNTIIVESTFSASEYHSRYCEPIGAIARPIEDGIVIYTVTQWPAHVQKSVAETLDISEKKVKIINTALSSPLEGRIWYPSLIACQAAVAAYISKKPVKILLSRYENNNYAPSQHPFRITYKSSVTPEGKLQKTNINIEINGGAFPIISKEIFDRAFISAAGLYECPLITITLSLIKTSEPPMSFISGFNFTYFQIPLEKHISKIISQLHISQVEWKKKNILQAKNTLFPPSDNKETDLSKRCATAVIDSVAKASDFERKYSAFELGRLKKGTVDIGKVSGIGLSLSYICNTIPLKSMEKEKLAVKLLLDSKSRLNIYTTTIPDGLNNYNIWKNCAEKILHIPTENIFIYPHETDMSPISVASPFSKGLGGFYEVLKKSCQSLQRKRFRVPLPIEINTTVSLSKINKIELAWGAAAVELSVDKYTYEIDIKGIWCCFDCGYLIDKEILDKTIYSSIMDSLNWVSGAEYLKFEKNKLIQTDNIWHFFNTPIYTEYLETAKKNKAISVSDLPLALIPAAYYNALTQALGYDINTIPITLDKLDAIFKDRKK